MQHRYPDSNEQCAQLSLPLNPDPAHVLTQDLYCLGLLEDLAAPTEPGRELVVDVATQVVCETLHQSGGFLVLTPQDLAQLPTDLRNCRIQACAAPDGRTCTLRLLYAKTA